MLLQNYKCLEKVTLSSPDKIGLINPFSHRQSVCTFHFLLWLTLPLAEMASCNAWGWRVWEADQAEIAASNTACHRHLMCMFSLGATRIWLMCCTEVLEQPFEGTALFSRKKEKGVSWNYKLCLYAVSTFQPEWHFLCIGKHVSTDSMQCLTTEEVIFAFIHSCINSCLTLKYFE